MKKTFQERIVKIMEDKGITQADISRLTNITQSSLSDYIKGKYSPKQDKIDLIAQALRVSPSYLMGLDNAAIATQLKKYRKQKKWSQEELSEKSFTPLERIAAFENEEEMPEGYEISALARALNVSVFDLYPNMPVEVYKDTYDYAKNADKVDGLMHDGLISFLYNIYGDVREVHNSSNKLLHYWEVGLNPDTFILTEDNLEHLREVSKASIKLVADYLGQLNQVHNSAKKEIESEDISAVHNPSETYTKFVPLYPRLASAGTGEYLFDDIPTDTIKIDAREYSKADYAIQVNGDSMEPTYYDGDTLIVERNAIPEIGKTGIFIVDGMGYVKRMGNGELLSDNKAYESIVGEYGKCLGKVLGKV